MSPIFRFVLICNIDGILSIIAFYGAYWLRLESFPDDLIINTLVVFFASIFCIFNNLIFNKIYKR